ncbi:hypothetical protein OG785_45315 [Streptomyces sp. NBC_00006]|uniref:hypothetical protein n=1 Tax=Streptomyces sp. NBC_00006 TaxID=2975619 RepID=UPI002252E74A|nr:hypothetical protein [Streptomyces sp. NBC_00006]MCX5528988.1 hypothetical protein [Streptomyces sp. NBC_00006]MCX5537780.1 hypothetical protein [Streptomyces sp. NBC_00006]
MTGPTTAPLWYGYSLADIDRISRLVISVDRWALDGTVVDRLDAVRFAITEHLLTAGSRPAKQDLVNVGRSASDRYVEAEMRYRGYDRRQAHLGRGASVNFQRFWQGNPRTPAEDRFVEHMTLTQIWPHLTLAQQQAVWAFALTGDHEAAASQLGLTPGAFAGRLKKARNRFAVLWHEHETPRRRPMDKRVLSRTGTVAGRKLLTVRDVEKLRQRRAEGATYRELAVETGYSASALCNLVNGKRRAYNGPVPAAA